MAREELHVVFTERGPSLAIVAHDMPAATAIYLKAAGAAHGDPIVRKPTRAERSAWMQWFTTHVSRPLPQAVDLVELTAALEMAGQ